MAPHGSYTTTPKFPEYQAPFHMEGRLGFMGIVQKEGVTQAA
jgi:hypothetical protein